MKFSDMMGSGGDRKPKHADETDSETAIANAIAPYLDSRVETEPVVVEPIDVDEPVAFAAPFAPEVPPPVVPVAPAEPLSPPLPPAAGTPEPYTPPAAPPEPRRTWQPDRPVPAEVPAPAAAATATATATAIADFTPLSDDLLPSRRR